jgi:pre-mRNA-processing factor 19
MSFVCNLSGDVPLDPVISSVSGLLYDRGLITKYINSNGNDPITGQPTQINQLISVKQPPQGQKSLSRPKFPQHSSLPAILQQLNGQFDEILVESWQLRQQIGQLQVELSHSLYQNDAAQRVIARLIKERDEARAAAANTNNFIRNQLQNQRNQGENGPNHGNAVAMEAELTGLEGISPRIQAILAETAKNLKEGRKDYTRNAQLVVNKLENVRGMGLSASHPLHSTQNSGISCLDICPIIQNTDYNDNFVATGGVDHNVILFNHSTGKIVDQIKWHKQPIVQVSFDFKSVNLFVASREKISLHLFDINNGKYFTDNVIEYSSNNNNNSAITGFSVHPSSQLLALSTSSGSWNLFEIATGKLLNTNDSPNNSENDGNIGYNCCSFHPDGLIFAVGSTDNLIRLFDVRGNSLVVSLAGHSAAVTKLNFALNGYYLAAGDSSGKVTLFDLRKKKASDQLIWSATPAEQDINGSETGGGAVASISFDQSSSYIAIAVAQNIYVYSIGEKDPAKWQLVNSVNNAHQNRITGLHWGHNAKFLASTGLDRNLNIRQ